MDALRSTGVRFSLDDFGTGTSSLALVKRLVIDYLKIDGSFVRDCATSSVDAAMLDAAHRLATLLGVETIAEFARDEAVVMRLRKIGVNYAQGWAFAQAQPIEELTKAISAGPNYFAEGLTEGDASDINYTYDRLYLMRSLFRCRPPRKPELKGSHPAVPSCV